MSEAESATTLDPATSSQLDRVALLWVPPMALAITLGAHLEIPSDPVPITLQTCFVLLAGFLLGPLWGGTAALLYLALGAAGLPLFAGGAAGTDTLFGPTGGFLLSFPVMAALAGVAYRPERRTFSWKNGLLWGGLASAAAFLLGVPWLEASLDLGWRRALGVGMLPFLPGAFLKLVLAIVTARLVTRWLPRSQGGRVTKPGAP